MENSPISQHGLENHLHSLGRIGVEIRICPNPVFIIGAPRSGTTILALSLAQHSNLWTSAESQILSDMFEGGRLDKNYERETRYGGSWLVNQGIKKRDFLAYIGLGINALFTSLSQGKRWVEHTPVYTLLANELVDMFPGARFLHILRDGRSVVHSMVNYLNLRKGSSTDPKRPGANDSWAKALPWAVDFRQACKTWTRYVDAATDVCARNSRRCLTIRHEELVADPYQGFSQIFKFIAAPCEQAPTDYFRSTRINSSFALTSGKQTENHRPDNPWRQWTPDQRRIFLDEAGDTMQKCNYASSDDVLYQRLLFHIGDVLRSAVPPDVPVLVVSKGDNELLSVAGRHCGHFPQTEDAQYAGCYPADSTEAILHLEKLRANGSRFLLFPNSAFWWLAHYKEFLSHLDTCYQRVHADERCILYQLDRRATARPCQGEHAPSKEVESERIETV